MDHSEIVGLALGPQFLENGELSGLTPREAAPHLRLPTHEQMMKGANRPLARGLASLAAILGHRLKGLALAPPAEDVSLVNRVQGVDEDQRAGDGNAG
jgi:hypothetical protein